MIDHIAANQRRLALDMARADMAQQEKITDTKAVTDLARQYLAFLLPDDSSSPGYRGEGGLDVV